VSVLGHVPDLKPVFDKVRVSVNPIRIGSGINTKIVLAMQYGVPVVSTLVGAEGIGLIDGITAAISDSAAAFAEKCIELYVNRGQWEQLVF
jgi:glycosyltransferase involved in cell wall biosynthesis